MRALQYLDVNQVAFRDVPVPALAPGWARLRVTAAGICRTDVDVRAAHDQAVPKGTVLGHEIAGSVVEIAGRHRPFLPGEPVVVHPVWSCGTCRACAAGRENACRGTKSRLHTPRAPGISAPGGLAEFVNAPVSALVRADGLDPALAAVLPDAGLVPYHSISRVEKLLCEGSACVVVGIGGLGQFAIEILRATTRARIIAVDTRESALDAVRTKVDRTVLADRASGADAVLAATGGSGADLVLDFVGSTATLELAASVIAPYGAIRVPGLGEGVFSFETSAASRSLPWGVSLARPYSGTHQDLSDLVALARTGRIDLSVARYSFEDALQAFDDVEAGRVHGRAVVIMAPATAPAAPPAAGPRGARRGRRGGGSA